MALRADPQDQHRAEPLSRRRCDPRLRPCEEDRPLLYMEDVGRHNAIDKIAGYMHLKHISPAGKIFYTTGG